MDVARYLVDAVVVEHRSLREVARAYGVSKSWVAILVGRYRSCGYSALTPRSKRPTTSPTRTNVDIESAVVVIRKELLEDGLDAGPTTIFWHLQQQHITPPSVSTIWRIIIRGGFITPQPKERPYTSYIRFEAALPNECWQADPTVHDDPRHHSAALHRHRPLAKLSLVEPHVYQHRSAQSR